MPLHQNVIIVVCSCREKRCSYVHKAACKPSLGCWEVITPVLGHELYRSTFEENLSLLSYCSRWPVTVPPRSHQRGFMGGPVTCSEIMVSESGAGSLWTSHKEGWLDARQHICVLLDEMTVLWEEDTLAGQPTRFVLVSLPVSCLILIFKVWNTSVYVC